MAKVNKEVIFLSEKNMINNTNISKAIFYYFRRPYLVNNYVNHYWV